MFSILHDLLDTSSVISPGVCKHPRYLMPQEREKQKHSAFWEADLIHVTFATAFFYLRSPNFLIQKIRTYLQSILCYDPFIMLQFGHDSPLVQQPAAEVRSTVVFTRCSGVTWNRLRQQRPLEELKKKTSTWNLDFCPHTVYSICSRTFGHVSGILFNSIQSRMEKYLL